MSDKKDWRCVIEEGVRARNIIGRKEVSRALDILLSDTNSDIKVSALASIISAILPDLISAKLEDKLLNINIEQLPINTQENNFVFIDKGMRSYVYKLEVRGSTFVVKVELVSYKAVLDDVVNEASNKKEWHAILKEYYKNIEGLIVDTNIVIGKSTDNNRLAIISIQEFLGNDLRGILQYTSEELIKLLRGNKKLKNDFVEFVKLTEELNEKGVFIDLHGKNNLCVVDNKRGKELKFIDLGTIVLLPENEQNRYKDEFISNDIRALKYLKMVVEDLKDKQDK